MKRKCLAMVGLAVSAVLMLSACGGTVAPKSAATSAKTTAASSAAKTASGSGQASTNKAVVTTKAGERTTANGKYKDKDTLVFSINAEPTSLEPGASSSSDSYSRICMIQCYETLLREAPADRTKLEPLVAESWEFAQDGKSVTFKIADGIKFSNGDTLTAEDVAFSLNKEMKAPAVSNASGMMDSAEVVDANHVKLNLKYSYKPVLNVLCNPVFSIIDKAYYEKCQSDGTNFGRNPIGTGAYVMKNWQNGQSITYEANPNWHGGKAAIKNLEIRFMSDATTAAIALESGDTDVFYGVDSADLPRLRENKDVNVLSVQSSGFYFIALNSTKAPLDNVNVRKAIALAVNRQEIIDGGQDGVGWVTECPITPGIFGYQTDFKAEAQNIDKAKQLLKDAGYANGLTINMKTPENSYYARPAQVIQEELRQIGITVNLSTMERGAFNQDVSNRDYDSIYFWTGASYPDADDIVYKLFNSQYANTTSITNMANVKNDDADKIINQARSSLDDKERMTLYGQLSKLNDDNAWYIPILTSTNTLCARAEVGGAYGNSAGFYFASDWNY